MTARVYPVVSRLWPGSTIVCLGTGPSLTKEDVELCRGRRARVIAVNDAYRLAPWADVLYAADEKWWRWHKGVAEFRGLKFSIDPRGPVKDAAGVQTLKNMGRNGLELQSNALRTGANSGYQAINLAVHLGAARIVLLGFDMQGDHFFGSHPDKTAPPFAACLAAMKTIAAPLAAAGVSIVNASRQTAITAFPRVPLEQALGVLEPVS